MEYFIQSKFVQLRTCRHKFLVAGDDGESVKQSSHGHTKKAQWTVELINNKPNMIRLRSCHNKLLAASDEPFLLGWTGKRVLQTVQTDCNPAVHWEPIRKDFYVKLRAAQTGKFLRANRGTPPWKGSVTVDIPERSTTRKWILWQVDILDADVGVDRGLWPRNCKSLQPAMNANATAAYKSSYSIMANEEPRERSTASSSEDEEDEDRSVWSDETEGVDLPTSSSSSVYKKQSRTELLQNAKTVRLRSYHGKYLVADEDQDSVSQDKKNGGSRRAHWTVEYVDSREGVGLVRLKSCYHKYLTATDDKFLTGATGKKVKQTAPQRLDSSLEWEPIREGMHLKLKTRYGNFLRANGGVPPWRNSVTHDVPSRTQSQDWVFWDVDILEVYENLDTGKDKGPNDVDNEDEDDGTEVQLPSHVSFKKEAGIEGRVVHYNPVDDDGNIVEGERSVVFQGNSVDQLCKMLEQETGLSHVIVCLRNPLNGKLYPIMLALPPSHLKLHVYVVPSSSKVAEELLTI